MILSLCPNPSIDMFTWVNDFEPGKVNRVVKEQRFPGGKGIHVALAAAELGEKAILLGFWGGPTGQWIKERCEMAGVSCYGPIINSWSRTCLSLKSNDKYDDTELLGCGPEISKRDYKNFLKEFDNLILKADCITMSGSWPLGAPSDAYEELIKKASTKGKKTFLDCTGKQLSNAMLAKPYNIHLNKTESALIFKEENPELLAGLLNKSCDYAAITAGADGLYLKNNSEHFLTKCAIEKVYSSVGSGDCLVAGLAVAFSRGLSTRDSARLAVACGGANCMRPELGMLKLKDVEMLLKKVIVKEL